jgi:flavodoxin
MGNFDSVTEDFSDSEYIPTPVGWPDTGSLHKFYQIGEAGGYRMKSVIIYSSVHHGNTAKVARTMADTLGAVLVKTDETPPESLNVYELIGFGSGIYFGSHHKSLLARVDSLPEMKGKKAFIFSTSGRGGTGFHWRLKEKLLGKKFQIVGEFSCKGFDTFSLLKIFGGINKGRPDEDDLREAGLFARKLLENTQGIIP